MATAATPTPSASRTVNTHMNYFLELKDGGTDIMLPGTAGNWLRKHNVQEMQVRDIRQTSEKLDLRLDNAGFQLVSSVPVIDAESIESKGYYSQTIELLKQVTGATHVVPFNHLVRRNTYESIMDEVRELAPDKKAQKLGPGMYSHVDQSYEGAQTVMRLFVEPEEAERFSKTRWGIMNAWRPLSPVLREPLGVCDSRSVPDEDLRVTKIEQGLLKDHKALDPGAAGVGDKREIFQVAYRNTHEWWYASEMQPDDALLIKIFDSKKDGRARRCVHSAFQLPDQDESAPARESVEIRCLVFWEDQSVE